MASTYPAFDCLIDDGSGIPIPVAAATVHVYDIDGATSLGTLTTDANGHIPSGTVTPAAPRNIRFTINLTNGQTGYAEVVTT
jgi:hypothetical protein